MQKSNKEWWECTNRMCGHKIQFVTLDSGPNRANPTCFCGSSMKRPYLKPQYTEYTAVSIADPGASHGAGFRGPMRQNDQGVTASGDGDHPGADVPGRIRSLRCIHASAGAANEESI